MLFLYFLVPNSLASVNVCGPEVGDPCVATIQEAIDSQSGPAFVGIGPGIYRESIDVGGRTVQIDKIRASDLDFATHPVIYGDAGTPVVRVSGGTLALKGLILVPTRARAIEAVDSVVGISDTALHEGGSGVMQGGVVHTVDSRLVLYRSRVHGGSASLAGGQLYALGGTVSIDGSSFYGGQTEGQGGQIWATKVYARSSHFQDGFARSEGSAVYVTQELELDDCHFFRGGRVRETPADDQPLVYAGEVLRLAGGSLRQTTGGLQSGGLVSVSDASITSAHATTLFTADRVEVELTSICDCAFDGPLIVGDVSVRIENTALLRTNAHTIAAPRQPGAELIARHNTLYEVGLADVPFGLASRDAPNTVENNLYAYTGWPKLESTIAFPASGRHDLWWPEVPARLHPIEPVVGDPGLSVPPAPDVAYCWAPTSYSLEGPIEGLVPSWYGAAVDAGVQGQLDPDGTQADLGAYGGSLLNDNAMWRDGDGDGVPDLHDCDDDDNTVYPGIEETPFDGVDQDCAGDSDFDLDGDGHMNTGFHGDDCDDSDPDRSPSHQEIPGNRIDDNCDGWVDEHTRLVVGSCASAPTGGGVTTWLWLAWLAGCRRRRTRASRRVPSTDARC